MQIDDLHPDDIIGATQFKAGWRLFAGTVAEWVMDYATYDPGFDPLKHSVVFRNNILRVDETNAVEFLLAMEPYELSNGDIRMLVAHDGPNNWPLNIVMNFDQRIYINGFSEIPLQRYIPTHWRGVEDFPLKYVPKEVAGAWVDKVE